MKDVLRSASMRPGGLSVTAFGLHSMPTWHVDSSVSQLQVRWSK